MNIVLKYTFSIINYDVGPAVNQRWANMSCLLEPSHYTQTDDTDEGVYTSMCLFSQSLNFVSDITWLVLPDKASFSLW